MPGVEPQSETVWRQADKYRVPRMCFVNKMDRTGANFDRCVAMMRDRLGANPVVVNMPIGSEADFKGVLDLVENRAIIWHDESLGAEFSYEEIPADMVDIAAAARAAMIEAAVEFDDNAMEAYLEGEEPDIATLKACIRKGTIASKLTPVLSGSAFKNKGVQPLLDAVIDYLPSPIELPPVEGLKPDSDEVMYRKPEDDAPFSALAFKIMTDPFVGSLTFARIYSGKVESGSYVQNTVKNKRERVGRLLLMHSNSREEIKYALAGDIVAFVGLKDTTTGDTLSDPAKAIVLERMEFPEPVIEVAVEPKTKADQEKMSIALNKLAQEDPSFRVGVDEESGQTVIKGMGELHLEILVDRMRREFKVDANVGAPQVAYRETITKEAEIDYTHKKQTGGSGQFARIKLVFAPGEKGTGFVFDSKIVGGSVPKEYIPGVSKGLEQSMSNGILAGFPMTDVSVRLIDGAYHEVDSSVMAFEIAARAAFKEGTAKAGPQLLEPIMRVEVVTPDEYMGDIIGDLNSRRGQVTGMEPRGNGQVVNAMVPLATMFGYVNTLRSLSQGRAQYSMHFDHYDAVPQMVAEEIRAKYA